MRIGEIATSTETPVETIRYYEREGLLTAPARSEGNYRIYGAAHQERLSFIRHCRTLDMNLEEIRVLLRFRDAPEQNCEGVNTLLDEHIEHVARRIGQLQALEKQLKKLRTHCRKADAAEHCGILWELAHSPASRKDRREAHVAGSHRRGGAGR